MAACMLAGCGERSQTLGSHGQLIAAQPTALLSAVDELLHTSGPPPVIRLDSDDPAVAASGLAAATIAAHGADRARIVVDPDQLDQASPVSIQLLLAHELVHVRLQPLTSTQTPLWAVEGFADAVAFTVTAAPTAGQWTVATAAGMPAVLPPDAGFTAAGPAQQAAYAQAWAFWQLILSRWGFDAARGLYDAIASAGSLGAFELAVQTNLGLSFDALQNDWIDSLEHPPQ